MNPRVHKLSLADFAKEAASRGLHAVALRDGRRLMLQGHELAARRLRGEVKYVACWYRGRLVTIPSKVKE